MLTDRTNDGGVAYLFEVSENRRLGDGGDALNFLEQWKPHSGSSQGQTINTVSIRVSRDGVYAVKPKPQSHKKEIHLCSALVHVLGEICNDAKR